MRRIILRIALVSVLIVLAFPALAAKEGSPRFSGPAGKSNVAFLDLYEIDASNRLVPDGAQGKLRYNLSGASFDFVFTGTRLDPNTEYTIIWSREPDMMIPSRFEIIGTGISDGSGGLYIVGSHTFNADLLSARILLIPSQYENPDRPIEHLEKFLIGQVPITFEEDAAHLKCGTNLRPEAPSFDALGPQAGDKAVDFTLWGFEPKDLNPVGNASQPLEKYTLSELLETKPVVLVFGAFT